MDYSFISKIQAEISKRYPIIEQITDIVDDGAHCHRYDSEKTGDKAIWLYVSTWEYKGNFYSKASFGNWKDGSKHEIKSYDKSIITKDFNKKEQEALSEAKEKQKEERRKKHNLCKLKWGPIYNNLQFSNQTHEYLDKKRIDTNFFAKITEKGALLVPAYNAKKEFVGAQQIFKDPESGKWIKRYTSGIEKLGSFCPMDSSLSVAEYVYIAEGFATAASISMALRESDKSISVIAAWDTSNLYESARAIRSINSNCKIIFAADRDINSNPKHHDIGYRKAKQASKYIMNSIVKKVSFKEGNDAWSDFNDLHMYEDLSKVREQLEIQGHEFYSIIPLGYDSGVNYIFSSSRNKIVKLSPNDMSANNLLFYAPEIFWGERYGFATKPDGEPTKSMSIKRIIQGVTKECIERGPFANAMVRGTGTWLEKNGKGCVNLGSTLFHDGKHKYLYNNDIESDYFYESKAAIEDIDMTQSLGVIEAIDFVNTFKKISFKDPSDSIILLGWLFSAQVFSALDWRPHIWITGQKGTGKSTILEYVDKCIPFSILTQDSTASGIRQEIKNNSRVIVYDESEPNNKKERAIMQDIITMARQASKKATYQSFRGTASGDAKAYNTNCNFCFGSIQVSELNEADKSRFFILELKKNDDVDPNFFYELEDEMERLAEMSNKLFVRAFNLLETLRKNIKLTSKHLRENKGVNARKADQLSVIIAGYFGFMSDDVINSNFIDQTLSEITYYDRDDEADITESDHVLETILDIIIPHERMTVGKCIDMIKFDDKMISVSNDRLAAVGLHYDKVHGELFVPTRNHVLSDLLKNTQYRDIVKLLSRHDEYVGKGQVIINGTRKRGIRVRV